MQEAPREFGCGVVGALPEALGWFFSPMEGGMDVRDNGIKCLWDALGIGLGIFCLGHAVPLHIPSACQLAGKQSAGPAG